MPVGRTHAEWGLKLCAEGSRSKVLQACKVWVRLAWKYECSQDGPSLYSMATNPHYKGMCTTACSLTCSYRAPFSSLPANISTYEAVGPPVHELKGRPHGASLRARRTGNGCSWTDAHIGFRSRVRKLVQVLKALHLGHDRSS